ncbi:MAG: hypothetical protein COV57_00335 [Candidatus Liptonbacteria bacterium CG11_big_fil_rev_8_21_14_0_20_35_14]|uniref:Prepilin-type N-terminal cleavage/methylation domain-containing protein n=1 Tax=Candidatus Liptonbacteria bacterium CG11_big_fil_rev_8_21_14_0_20_35_14 TaxID=1974634 RepID=A0A2H0N8I3_9BACT|nr:MAG: hypothetical protein COV57_00335 [Candidatus Liptonbacteria bacterium CG11_big_fil_rev_8_21_14_0_20_35_14]
MINLRDKKGFTVVEMLVAVGLFTTIITIAIGAYIRVLKTQSFMTSIMSANDNVSLVLEQIAREIRTGDNMPSGGYSQNSIKFKNDEDDCVAYALEIDNEKKYITRATSLDDNCSLAVYSDSEALTSDNVLIEDLNFTVVQTVTENGSFERVQIEVTVNVVDPVTGEVFFTSQGGGNQLKTFVATRKYFGR